MMMMVFNLAATKRAQTWLLTFQFNSI
jgi:hypothetical protein